MCVLWTQIKLLTSHFSGKDYYPCFYCLKRAIRNSKTSSAGEQCSIQWAVAFCLECFPFLPFAWCLLSLEHCSETDGMVVLSAGGPLGPGLHFLSGQAEALSDTLTFVKHPLMSLSLVLCMPRDCGHIWPPKSGILCQNWSQTALTLVFLWRPQLNCELFVGPCAIPVLLRDPECPFAEAHHVLVAKWHT